MIAYIACDNLDNTLGAYFEECAEESEQYLKEYIQADPIIIKGVQLNQVNIDIRLENRGIECFIFAAYSHGVEDALKANSLPYIKSGENTHLFSKGLIYSNACLAAQDLGFDLIDNGAFAYVGYNEEIPVLEDSAAKRICKIADNYALILFLRGISIGEAVERAKNFLSQKILQSDEIKNQIKAELIEIRDAMEIVGNKELTISDLLE